MAGPAPGLLELHAAVLATVKRLQQELDLAERIRRQVRMRRAARPRLTERRAPSTRHPGPADELAPDDETQVLPRLPRGGPDEHRP
jgi:hypothetical protein